MVETKLKEAFQVVVVHELGHALWLADLSRLSGENGSLEVYPYSVMRSPESVEARINPNYYWSQQAPQPVDFVGVVYETTERLAS